MKGVGLCDRLPSSKLCRSSTATWDKAGTRTEKAQTTTLHKHDFLDAMERIKQDD